MKKVLLALASFSLNSLKQNKILILILIILLAGCRPIIDDDGEDGYIHFIYSSRQYSIPKEEIKFVFSSMEEFKAEKENLSGVSTPSEGYFDEYKLLVFIVPNYYNLVLNHIEKENESLILDLYGTTHPEGSTSNILMTVRIAKDIKFADFDYTIREPRGAEGKQEFVAKEYNSWSHLKRYDSEIKVNIAPTHESIIINTYSLFSLYAKKNPGYTSFDISKYDEEFFKDKTLIIYNIDSPHSYTMKTESVEITERKIFTKFSRLQMYEPAHKFYSMWIEIEKNETILSADYEIYIKY